MPQRSALFDVKGTLHLAKVIPENDDSLDFTARLRRDTPKANAVLMLSYLYVHLLTAVSQQKFAHIYNKLMNILTIGASQFQNLNAPSPLEYQEMRLDDENWSNSQRELIKESVDSEFDVETM